MLGAQDERFLRDILTEGRIERPVPLKLAFADNFVPVHLKCHLTAMQVAIETGFEPVIGIAFIDLHEKLYPWPHVVNRRADGVLVDASPPIPDPVLGFIETGWTAISQWRRIITVYNALAGQAHAARWGDAIADRLTDDFLPGLRAGSVVRQRVAVG